MKYLKRYSFLGLLPLVAFLQNCSQASNTEAHQKQADPRYYTLEDFKSVEKYDAHVHFTRDIDTVFIQQGKADNFRFINVNVYSSTGRPISELRDFALAKVQEYPGRSVYATTFSLQGFNEDDWHAKTIAYLQDSFDKGAVGVKVHKNIGMELKDKNEELVMIDHPRMDPILDFLEKSNIPLIGHLGEHRNSWLPLEKMTVKGNRDYAAAHPEHHMYLHPERPSYEHYIAVRDHMLEKHPNLRFVGAHLGSLEWSVDELAKRLDKFPNMAVDMAERISHLQYQALTEREKVRDFFIKYQDRLIYGTDMRHSAMDIVNNNITEPAALMNHAHAVWMRHWRFFTTDEKMRVPKVDGEFRGLKLPREVVDKIYHRNAEKWFPGLKKVKEKA